MISRGYGQAAVQCHCIDGTIHEVAVHIITGSLLMVMYDIILEPAAVRLDMWSGECGVLIPLQNFPRLVNSVSGFPYHDKGIG